MLEDVCKSGNIEKDDLMHILYYAGVAMYEVSGEDGEQKEIDFKPQTEISGKLNGKLEEDIKQAIYLKYKESIDKAYQWIIDKYGYGSNAQWYNVKRFGRKRDVVFITEYCGKYKDMHIVKVRVPIVKWYNNYNKSLQDTYEYLQVYEDIAWHRDYDRGEGTRSLDLMLFKYK